MAQTGGQAAQDKRAKEAVAAAATVDAKEAGLPYAAASDGSITAPEVGIVQISKKSLGKI